jgi:hypothetical protein
MPRAAAVSLAVILYASGLLSSARAQSVDRWSRLRLLQADDQIRVELNNGERWNGAVRGFSADRFTLIDRGGRAIPVERDSAKAISRKSRGRGALYGLLVGFGAGFVVGAAAGPYITDFGNPGAGRRVKYGVGWGAFSGGIGAGIGALAGARVKIYP